MAIRKQMTFPTQCPIARGNEERHFLALVPVSRHIANAFFKSPARLRIVRADQKSAQVAKRNILTMQCNTNETCSNTVSKTTRRKIDDDARTPAVDILSRTRDLQLNWLVHILKMEPRLFSQLLMGRPWQVLNGICASSPE